MISIKTTIAFFVCAFALASCTPYVDCGSKQGTITNFTVGGCDKMPCVLERGTNVSFEMHFTANENISSAESKIRAHTRFGWVPFYLSDPNACHHMTCPIAKGEKDLFKQKMYINPLYPKIKAVVQWRLMQEGNVITCFQVEGVVQDKQSENSPQNLDVARPGLDVMWIEN